MTSTGDGTFPQRDHASAFRRPAPEVPEPTPGATGVLDGVLDEVERVVVGKREQLTLLLAAVLARGHVLLEDVPGLGKTVTARTLATVLGLEFKRAQFTPDLLPADLTGSFVFDQRKGEFVFRPGPVFAGFLLADEINRTPPKTQAALLEAMQEGQVTVEGETFALPSPFVVVATANPIEQEGTYALPEAQLDRFLLRLSFGYATADEEWRIVADRLTPGGQPPQVRQLLDPAGLAALQAAADGVHVEESVGRYAVALARATREHGDVIAGASPRGSLALVNCARALALLEGRDFVVPDDVRRLAQPALAHRVVLKPELWLTGATASGIVDEVLRRVPVPDAPRSARG